MGVWSAGRSFLSKCCSGVSSTASVVSSHTPESLRPTTWLYRAKTGLSRVTGTLSSLAKAFSTTVAIFNVAAKMRPTEILFIPVGIFFVFPHLLKVFVKPSNDPQQRSRNRFSRVLRFLDHLFTPFGTVGGGIAALLLGLGVVGSEAVLGVAAVAGLFKAVFRDFVTKPEQADHAFREAMRRAMPAAKYLGHPGRQCAFRTGGILSALLNAAEAGGNAAWFLNLMFLILGPLPGVAAGVITGVTFFQLGLTFLELLPGHHGRRVAHVNRHAFQPFVEGVGLGSMLAVTMLSIMIEKLGSDLSPLQNALPSVFGIVPILTLRLLLGGVTYKIESLREERAPRQLGSMVSSSAALMQPLRPNDQADVLSIEDGRDGLVLA